MHKLQHITEQEIDLLNYFYDYRRGHVRQIKKAVKLSEHTLLMYTELMFFVLNKIN